MESSVSFDSPNLFSKVEHAFRLYPDQVALVSNEEAISYSELEIRVACLSELIKTKVPDEQLIAVSCTRSIQTIVNILAILASGKAYLPLDLDVPEERLQKIVTETKLKFGLTGSSQESFDGIHVREINETLPSPIGVVNRRAEQAYILFTSGSTGTPKGIAIPHSALISFFDWQNGVSNSRPGYNTLHFAKLTFDISVQEIFTTLSTGGTFFIAEDTTLKDPLLLLEFIEKNQINRIFFPFIALQGMCNAANAYRIFPTSLKEVTTCGEQLKASLAVRKFFKNMKDCILINQYGPTEATIIMTELRLGSDVDQWEDLPTIGKPVAEAGVVLVNGEGKLITEPGVVGEMYISGPGLAIGYFNNPTLTAEKFPTVAFEGVAPTRYFKTGDLAELTPDGELRFKCRIDDQIKISGFRIELSDIEANVSMIEGIDENVVTTDSYSDGALYLKLFYTSGDASLTEEVIRRKLEKVLPEYMIPAQFYKVDHFPKTGSGKVDRKALAKTEVISTQAATETKGQDSQDLAKVLRKIWKDILQVEDFTAESNFFNLGGRSILAQKLSLEISEKLGIRFPVAFTYQYPTLKSQVKFLSEKTKQWENQSEKPTDKEQSRQSKDVAVIAMAGKFPKANTVEEFWEMIKNKREGITFFDIEEIDPLIRAEAEESNYVKARGIVEGVENFDAEYFGINPKLAAIMDPQQRLFMEICHEALEKAGWIANRPDFKIGVFGGSNYNSYFNKNIVFDQELLDVFGAVNILSLNEKDYLTSRTAFQLNLKGPAVSVYSACSTSLLAVAQAVDSIRNGQCVAALAGGSSVTFPVRSGQVYEEGAIFSIDGHCKPFDATSTGTVFCDGAGVLLLKSYEQALADGDPIFAVIKGVAVNNDGSDKASFTSPSVLGQADVIKSAMSDANVVPSQIGFIEAHGTATPIGDPIEIEGLKLAFGDDVPFQSCSISSVKSNIGHLTAAAGIAGLIKTICALHEKVLPASLGYDRPNPEIDFERSPFYVQKETAPWSSDQKRIAGVSSFGFGGTNVHVIVEEFTAANQKQSNPSQEDNLITFSAKTEKSLTLFAGQLHEYVSARPTLDLTKLSQNLLKRTAPFELQQSLRASSREELLDLLQKAGAGDIKPVQRLGDFIFPVFLFPGQGAQYLGMGKSFYEANEVFRTAFNQCCEEFDRYLPTSLKFEIFGGSSETLANTRYTQPAIFAVSYSLSMALMAMGIQPAAFCGHSIGEYVGAHLAGIFSLEDAIKVVAYRGKLISQLPGGNMLSVRSKTDIIQELLPDQLSLAAHNAPNLCVVSGPVDAIEDFKTVLDGYGIPSQILKTSHAFHSAMMDGALDEFSSVIASVDRHIPKVPVMSTQTGKWLTDAEAQSVEYWTGHLRNAVLFHDAAATLLQELPEAYFIEVGPGNVLNSLMQQQSEGKKFPVIHTLSRSNTDSERSLLIEQLGLAKAKGAGIDLSLILQHDRFEFLDIPTYAFDKKLCWNQSGARFNPAFQKKGNQVNGSTHQVANASVSVPLITTVNPKAVYKHFGRLKSMLESASGISISENDLELSFFELGLDSLILTQFTFSLKKEFGVQISFRQLNDTHNTPKSILDFLDKMLPDSESVVPVSISEQPLPVQDEKGGNDNRQNRGDAGMEAVKSPGLSCSKLEKFQKMRRMIELASGVVISEDDLDSSFFELGLDSLILTQFVFSLKKEFGVQISFRQLNDALNTPKSILDYLEASNSATEETAAVVAQAIPSGEGSISLLKQQLAEITQQVKEIESAHVNSASAKTVLSQGHLANGKYPVSENLISSIAKTFLTKFGEEYSKKTARSKSQALRLQGEWSTPHFVNGYPGAGSEDFSYTILTDRTAGARMFDLDGNPYLDWTNGKGINLFGNNPTFVNEALKIQLAMGTDLVSISAQADSVRRLIGKICQIEQFAICASESEAKMRALQLAKTVSSKPVVVKFSPQFHPIDGLCLEKAICASNDEVVLEYGTDATLDLIAQFSDKIAAVWFEPIQDNNPESLQVDFLKRLSALTESLGICLIMDETFTGFRVHPGGLQGLLGIQPDLTVYGAMENSGFPLTILGGKSKWLSLLTEANRAGSQVLHQDGNSFGIYSAETLHPLALTTAKSILNELVLRGPALQERLAVRTDELVSRMNEIFARFNCPYKAVRFKSIWRILPVSRFPFWEVLFAMLRHEGVHIGDEGLCYMTESHTAKDLDYTVLKLENVLVKLIENELVIGDLPDLEEVLMDVKNPPFPGAKIGFDNEGNPIWVKPSKK